MSTKPFWALLFTVLLIAGCGGEAGQTADDADGSAQEDAMSAPEAEPAAQQPATIGDLFPEGEGRILTLNNCASCHAVACAVIGQRTPSRWSSIQAAHSDRLPGMTQEDFETIFAYLESNFNDTQPEPNVPAAFLQRGCTPN